MKLDTTTAISSATTLKRVLVYGGAFNPPTLGHQDIIDAALNESQYDEIWLMPSRDRIDKTITVDEATRLAMLRRLVTNNYGGETRLKVTDFEYSLPQPTQTYQTHQALRTAYPSYRFTYLVGEDSIATMPSWQSAEALLTGLDWLAATRQHTEIKRWPDSCRYLPVAARNISSTMVRQRAQTGDDYRDLVSPSIATFIRNRRLYE